MKKYGCMFALVAVIGLCIAPVSHADELSRIKAAIAAEGAKWIAGETSMSRLTKEERRMHRGALPSFIKEGDEIAPRPDARAAAALPTSVDWRNYSGSVYANGNYVTSIKYQGICGGCWAFSSAGALESLTLMANRTPGVELDLSEQVLIDCLKPSENSCRSGGHIDQAATFIQTAGLPGETCYPFAGQDLWSCGACTDWQQTAYKSAKWKWVANWYNKLNPKVDAIRSAVATYGPVVTTYRVFADFDYYVSGIYEHVHVAGDEDDYSLHAVLIVGYNDAGQYFIVKNSWGSWWGESGFFRIAYSQVSNDVLFGGQTIAYEALTPKVSVTPAALSFGAIKTGSSSAGKTVAVKNLGKGNLIVGTIGFTGTNATEFSQWNDCTLVGPGAACSVTVAASPNTPYGAKSATLQIPTNDTKKLTSTVRLTATASPPRITVTPGALSFGAVTGSATKTLNVKNTGVSDLTINSVNTTGTGAAYFTITGSCGVIVSKGQCTLQVAFTPDSRTARTARIEIVSDDPAKKGKPVTVNLTGRGK